MDVDEEQAMARRADKLTDDSLAATHRMKNMMEESTDAGVNTLVMLDEQGEQLNRIEDGMDQINNDMRDAEAQLNNLDKCCGCCVCPWNRIKNVERGSKYKKTWNKDTDAVTTQPKSTDPTTEQGNTNTFTTQNKVSMIHRVTNDDREDMMDDNLQQVSGLVSNLKNMALDMGTELEKQSAQITRISDKAEMNQGRIIGANERANRILTTK